ncbi:DUF3325 family protein [Arenimonas sp.]|uniref:DUF3325 family protein n=1 Tax=Arenimonas sp. TaxID=1872635 RepID=UPI0035AEC76D
MITPVFALNLLAWALLALGLPGHHRAWFGRPLSPVRRRVLRTLGWLCLPAGWGLAVVLRGYELGSVLWAASLMLAALAWALLMAAREAFSAGVGQRPGAAGARRAGPRPSRRS